MKRLDPEVTDLETEGNQLSATLRLPEDLEYFEGHFPFQPILPAVVQVGWVLEFATEHLPFTGEPEKILDLKFRRKLGPGDQCLLSVDWEPDESRLSFTLRQDEDRVASGRISVTNQ